MHNGFPQSIIHDRGTAFVNTEFVTWTKEFDITLRPKTANSTWTNGKVETWALLAAKFAFATTPASTIRLERHHTK